MNREVQASGRLPPGQEAFRAKCFHPNGLFEPFGEGETEQSISDRFEQPSADTLRESRSKLPPSCSRTKASTVGPIAWDARF